jgi:F1F0 ATPase subunit 2
MTDLTSSTIRMFPSLLAYFLFGLAVGALFFVGLWRTVARAPSPWLIVLSSVGRLAVLGGALLLVAREGAAPLMAAGVGILLARAVVVGRLGGVRP